MFNFIKIITMVSMKSISVWASNNKIQARILIGLFQFLLFILGVILGLFLFKIEFKFSLFSLLTLLTIFLGVYYFYPHKRNEFVFLKHFYFRQKLFDFTLVISSFVIVTIFINLCAFTLNQNDNINFAKFTAVHINNETAKANINVSPHKNSANFFQKCFRGIKNTLSQTPQKSLSENDTTGQVILVVLIVLMAILLGSFVAAWSCRLSCSGQSSAAGLVIILGFGSIITGSIFAIKAILRKV